MLSGAPNDEAVLQSVVMMAARERREVKVTLAPAFPKSGFLRMLDAALGRVALAGGGGRMAFSASLPGQIASGAEGGGGAVARGGHQLAGGVGAAIAGREDARHLRG